MSKSRSQGMHPAWWTLILLIAIIGIIALTSTLFSGSFKSYVPVTLMSDRAGLVMEIGSQGEDAWCGGRPGAPDHRWSETT